MGKLIYLIIAVTLLFCSCHNNETKRKKVKHKHAIKVGDVKVSARLLPAMQKEEATESTDKVLTCFSVKIDKSNAAFDKSKTMYLNFDMQQDFVMTRNQDSIIPVFCQRIENGNAESFEYIIAFEAVKDSPLQGLTLIYKDKLFGIGTVAFAYDQNDIKKVQ